MVDGDADRDAVLLGDGDGVSEIVGDFVAASHRFHDNAMQTMRILQRARGVMGWLAENGVVARS
jgi:hypothetical protein